MHKKKYWILSEAALICNSVLINSDSERPVAVIHLEHVSFFNNGNSIKYSYAQRATIEYLVSKNIIKVINKPKINERTADNALYKVSFRKPEARLFLKRNKNRLAYSVEIVDDAIFVNGYKTAQMHAGKDIEVIFKHIYKNPGVIITRKDLSRVLEKEFKGSLINRMRDINFTRDLKEIFFPVLSTNRLEFVNNITIDQAINRQLTFVDFTTF